MLPFEYVLVEAVKLLREKGEVTKREFEEKVGKDRLRTLYRVLNALERAELVKQPKKGVYRWYEVERTYTREECEVLSQHAELLRDSVLFLLEKRGYDYERAKMFMPELLSHLKTGYPEVYRTYIECEEMKKRIDKLRDKIKEEIKERIEKTFGGKTSLDTFAELILERAIYVVRGYRHFADDIKYLEMKESGIYYRGTLVLNAEEGIQEVAEFISKTSDEILEKCERVVELENEYYEKRKELKKGFERILKKIECGMPLKGRCEICSDVRVVD